MIAHNNNQVRSYSATVVDHLRNSAGKVACCLGGPASRSVNFDLVVAPGCGLEIVAHQLPTEPPTWKRFADAPPPDGFYWSRYADEPPGEHTIVEVDNSYIRFLGTDFMDKCSTADSREYFTQPILPPV